MTDRDPDGAEASDEATAAGDDPADGTADEGTADRDADGAADDRGAGDEADTGDDADGDGVVCAHCGATDTEPISLFGTGEMTMQYECRACNAVFERVKWA